MGVKSEQIERHIEQQRHELLDNMVELEEKVTRAISWRSQVEQRPLMMMGLAFGGGVFLSVLLGGTSRRSTQREPTASSTWENVKEALLGVAMAKAAGAMEHLLPGFHEEYKKGPGRHGQLTRLSGDSGESSPTEGHMPDAHTAFADGPTTEVIVPDPSSPIHVRNIAFTLLSVAIVILLLQFMQSVLIPFVIAGLLFYALDAAVDWLQKKRIPRAVGAGVMLLIVVAGTATLAYSLQGQALAVIDQLPTGARKLAALMSTTPGAEPGPVEKVQQAADALQQSDTPPKAPSGVVRVQVEDQGFRAGTFVWSGSVGLMSAANQAIMVLFLTYFMLLSDQLFKRKLVKIVGTFSQKRMTINVLEAIAVQIRHFMVIQIVTSGAVAIVTGAALWMMGLQQAALWGLLAGIFNSIPYYGPLLVTTGLAIVGFLQFGTPGMTAAVAGASLLITSLEGTLLTPMLVSRASSMNQVAVFVGLLFWSWVWGIWGMLLAVPMMMAVKVLCDHVEPLQPVAHLLSD